MRNTYNRQNSLIIRICYCPGSWSFGRKMWFRIPSLDKNGPWIRSLKRQKGAYLEGLSYMIKVYRAGQMVVRLQFHGSTHAEKKGWPGLTPAALKFQIQKRVVWQYGIIWSSSHRYFCTRETHDQHNHFSCSFSQMLQLWIRKRLAT